MSFWTEEQDAFVAEQRGLMSAGEMSNQPILRGKSRSAILGRVNRLGLPKLKSDNPRAKRVRNRSKVLRPKQSKPLPAPVERAEFKPLNIPFMQLTPFQCREVTGHDYLALYCGHPIYKLSNCAWHFSVNRVRRT